MCYCLNKKKERLPSGDGDVASAVAALTKPGASARGTETRMVQHLVLQGDGCGYADLSMPELVEALEEHCDTVDAAKRLVINPIVLIRSREEEAKERIAQAVPFAPVSGARVKKALNDAKDDMDEATASVVEETSQQEASYQELQMVLSVMGTWKSNVDVALALAKHDFDVFAAAAELTGIEGFSTTTWGKGQTKFVEAFK